MSLSKAGSILEKSRELLQENKFYEYEQKLKTLSSRYYNTGKFEEASELLLGGAVDLIANNQTVSAYGLANTALQAYKDKNKEFDEPTKKRLLTFLSKAPWDKNKPLLVNTTLKWFYPKNQDQDILRFICEDSLHNKEYPVTQRFLLRCQKSADLAIQMLNEWMQLGAINEKELFVARFVLMKLACGGVEDAKIIIEEYAPKLNYPIIQFTRLLVKTVIVKSKKAYEVLCNNHKKTYTIDPSFSELVAKVGAVYFGIKPEKEEGLLDSMMKFFSD